MLGWIWLLQLIQSSLNLLIWIVMLPCICIPLMLRKCQNSLQNLKDSVTGHIGISAKELKAVHSIICLPISHIINLSFKAGIFPQVLKDTIVTPVHKGEIQAGYIQLQACLSPNCSFWSLWKIDVQSFIYLFWTLEIYYTGTNIVFMHITLLMWHYSEFLNLFPEPGRIRE